MFSGSISFRKESALALRFEDEEEDEDEYKKIVRAVREKRCNEAGMLRLVRLRAHLTYW
jgi:hypothetical protein